MGNPSCISPRARTALGPMEVGTCCRSLDNSPLGAPNPRIDFFSIPSYAWNEFGEGGILAPARGENYGKLKAIRDLFPNKQETNKTRQP